MASRAESKTRKVGGVAPLTAAQRRALAWLAKDRLLDGLYLADGVAVAHYLGALVRTGLGPEGVPIASLRDLAVMKLAAIAKRGVRRDY